VSPLAIRLGRATLSTIRANVAAALAIKVITVVLAIAGVATLWMCRPRRRRRLVDRRRQRLRLPRRESSSPVTPMAGADCATIRPMQRRLTLLMAALCVLRIRRDAANLADDGRAAVIAPPPDFLTVGSSVVLEARLTEGTSPPRASWPTGPARTAASPPSIRSGRVSALAPGSTTIRATFGADTASLAMRAPDSPAPGPATGASRPAPSIRARTSAPRPTTVQPWRPRWS
jgi:hypothetical protein